ncbi:hypothetical protein [Pseudonocardia asaccharolytica]|uniref:DUF2269 domain-containing protein n=1 Tax=Pseudonocardia asaccharolytica DSM 44247 = NBRC 16224 TaxID=1123024 RepID=A0A511CZ46_9PSEU|nr:hypothetical protein [Pseudonocardia asaccharolytica]GEL17821.1 hypothetical protein PA7_16580 [Pseudonocardia asaccharolytica DSM 44247 = NBRC 16224]
MSSLGLIGLILWIITALGGFVMLGRWISRGGLRQQRSGVTRFPAGAVFSHFALAAAGLVLWIIYLVLDAQVLTWVSLAVLVVVAGIGFGLFSRWLPVYRGRAVAATGGPGAAGATAASAEPAERHLPVPVVLAHGLFGAATLVVVLLVALGVGGS